MDVLCGSRQLVDARNQVGDYLSNAARPHLPTSSGPLLGVGVSSFDVEHIVPLELHALIGPTRPVVLETGIRDFTCVVGLCHCGQADNHEGKS